MILKTSIKKIAPHWALSAYHWALASLAAFWYRHPARKLVVIGVTGTNGKSSTVQFIGRMLEHLGRRVGWTSTASFKIADREWVNDRKMTMLGRFETHRMIRAMARAGCGYAIIETSSEGMAQWRHAGINYDVAVFTNLTPEHIEAHGGFENYKRAKGRLFQALARSSKKCIKGKEIQKTSIVNVDDPHADYFAAFPANVRTGFGLERKHELPLDVAPVVPDRIELSSTGTIVVFGNRTLSLETVGRFYLQNILAAMAVLRSLGFPWDAILSSAEHLEPVPGRLERIDEGQPFTVIVDYAYEPAALAAVYDALELLPHKRIIHIIGSCGGGRDVSRRVILGEMAAERDDIVIVANEDPYDEDPWLIINAVADAAVAAGKQEGVNLFRILDRQEAINKAVALAEPGDLVLITAKGSEPVMAVAHGKKIPWDDRVAARQALKLISNSRE